MTDETTPKTAEELLTDFGGGCTCDGYYIARKMDDPNCFFHQQGPDIIDAMKAYARQIAQQVRQQCAEEAKLTYSDTWPDPRIDKESILSVDIERFLL